MGGKGLGAGLWDQGSGDWAGIVTLLVEEGMGSILKVKHKIKERATHHSEPYTGVVEDILQRQFTVYVSVPISAHIYNYFVYLGHYMYLMLGQYQSWNQWWYVFERALGVNC